MIVCFFAPRRDKLLYHAAIRRFSLSVSVLNIHYTFSSWHFYPSAQSAKRIPPTRRRVLHARPDCFCAPVAQPLGPCSPPIAQGAGPLSRPRRRSAATGPRAGGLPAPHPPPRHPWPATAACWSSSIRTRRYSNCFAIACSACLPAGNWLPSLPTAASCPTAASFLNGGAFLASACCPNWPTRAG